MSEHAQPHPSPEELLARNERRTWMVVGLTALTMVAELVAGALTGSLALLADGWHMASHAGALGLSAGAYWFARRQANRPSFVFGTGKVYALAGYTSAVALALVAALMAAEGVERLLNPRDVLYAEALPVAVIGLVVNLLSARLLHPGGDHHNGDHNLRAAYFHVLADALTSILAILALVAGQFWGIAHLDPLMGIVGGAVILRWAWGLCRGAARQLLDLRPRGETAELVERAVAEIGDDEIADLRLWEVGPHREACALVIASREPQEAAVYRQAILAARPLHFLVVEVRRKN